MEITFEILDTRAATEKKEQPTRLFDAAPSEVWYVPTTPLAIVQSDTPPGWSYAKGGIVRVPLHPYLFNSADDRAVLAGMLQVAAVALGQFERVSIRRTVMPTRVHWIVGSHDEPQPATFRLWLGVALMEPARCHRTS